MWIAGFALFVAAHAAAQNWPPAPPLPVAADLQSGPLPPSITAQHTETGRWRCTFEYAAELGQPTPRSVALAGTFNGWNKAATPLRMSAGGTWSAAVDLPAGMHLYKFVLDDERWIADPRNPDTVHDGHDGRNSVLRLGRIANLRESPARSGDGQIDGLALEHDPRQPSYLQYLAGGRALLRLRTLSNDVESVRLSCPGEPPMEMSVVSRDPLFTLWEVETLLPKLPAPPDQTERPRFVYTFVLTDGSAQVVGPRIFDEVPRLESEIFHTPDWAKHAIWYQIFPDRFRNGDPSNDRQPVRPWTSEWFTPSPWEGQDGQTFYKFFVFDRQYGGDLAGIEEKLGYLKELGVNALYLNPVFQSESNHKYNATNYVHIDEHFGTLGDYEPAAAKEDLNDPSTWVWTESDKKFLRLLKKAHALGFKVIIDGVFNHVGTLHPAFQSVQRLGRESPYVDWFNVTSWEPFKYEGWFGHDALPVFRKSPDGLASEQVKRHIFAVTRRWMDPDGDGDPSDGIDGWRLDVPNEIPAPFWVEWRKLVKSINPEAYITGEIWDRADAWLDGRHFDAVMNYEFARAVVAWAFNVKLKESPSVLDRRLRDLRLAYPRAATLVLQNLMNSHDTDRLASMAHNPDRAYDHANRVQDNGPHYDNSKPSPAAYAKARLAALVQMTYVGAPMVYYGDEVGMWGGDDPNCRKPMLWADLEPYEQPEENFVMRDQLAFYRRAIALRADHPALRTGSFQTLLTDDAADVWAFLRKDEREQLIVALNGSDRERTVVIPLPPSAAERWRGVFNCDATFEAEGRRLTLTIPPVAGVVVHAPAPQR